MEEYVPYKSVTLEKLQFGLSVMVAKEVDAEYRDHALKFRITGYVWSQDAGKRVSFKYPADWWQAFKERWFKGWLLKRYPVIYTYKEFQVKATYPELTVQSHEPVLRLLEQTYTDDFYRFLRDSK